MIAPLVGALRPKQWTKNLLVFAGVVFSQHLTSGPFLLRAGLGFLAFSLLAGTVYMVNDLLDVEADRQHPRKRHRPIASGRLPVPLAWAAVPVLAAGVAALSWWLGPSFTLVVAIYLVSNTLYSVWLKHQPIIDVFLIANGFVLRAIAGVELLRPVEPNVELSPWLLVCTFFLSLFLGLSKRRREIANAGSAAGAQRAVLREYTPELLDGLLNVSASAALMGYALYTMWPTTVAKFGTEALLYTVPFVAYGLFRYFYLVRTSETSEDPSMVLLTDRPLQIAILAYLGLVAWVLYGGR